MGKKGSDRRRQKRQAKRKEQRRVTRKARQGAARNRGRRMPDLPGFSRFTDDDQRFWLAHGVNYIVSDYDNGVWQPLFPEIYDGETPSEEIIAQRVMDRFEETIKQGGYSDGQAATAWLMQTKQAVFSYRLEALKNVRVAQPEADAESLICQPHTDAVWRVFESLKRHLRH